MVATKAIAAASLLVLGSSLFACTRVAAPEPKTPLFGFTTEEQRIVACLDLQDHIVDLYADEYVSREGVRLTAHERTAFRDGWAEQLAKRGTFEAFEQSCFGSLTTQRFDCGMSSHTTGAVDACMRLSSR
jgi:hypothetical protein